MTKANPLCVAIDTSDLREALELVERLKNEVGYIKLGFEFFYSLGCKGYEAVAALGVPVFLDLKLHDIPNTVAKGMGALMQFVPMPAIVNLHASGGEAMMRAARTMVPASTKLIAVTILTSLSEEDIWAVGFDKNQDTAATALHLARLAKESGLDGVVCSPHDVTAIKRELGPDFMTIVPGIRVGDGPQHDQKRIATPRAAYEAGADILVIGRAITEARDPVIAARKIKQELKL